MTHPRFQFDGATYVPERDHDRLASLLVRVRHFMLWADGEWMTPKQIMDAVNHWDWASISARLRDLRKPKFGGYDVQRKRGENGLHYYRLVRRDDA